MTLHLQACILLYSRWRILAWVRQLDFLLEESCGECAVLIGSCRKGNLLSITAVDLVTVVVPLRHRISSSSSMIIIAFASRLGSRGQSATACLIIIDASSGACGSIVLIVGWLCLVVVGVVFEDLVVTRGWEEEEMIFRLRRRRRLPAELGGDLFHGYVLLMLCHLSLPSLISIICLESLVGLDGRGM